MELFFSFLSYFVRYALTFTFLLVLFSPFFFFCRWYLLSSFSGTVACCTASFSNGIFFFFSLLCAAHAYLPVPTGKGEKALLREEAAMSRCDCVTTAFSGFKERKEKYRESGKEQTARKISNCTSIGACADAHADEKSSSACIDALFFFDF